MLLAFLLGIVFGGWIEKIKLDEVGPVNYLQSSYIPLILFVVLAFLWSIIGAVDGVHFIEMYAIGVFIPILINIEKINLMLKNEEKDG